MAIGRMREKARITRLVHVTDAMGFAGEEEITLREIRCEKEGRHGSERWANLATFSEATDIFRFRVIPGLKVSEDMFIIHNGERYNILSVETVKGRGMYLEVMAKANRSSDGKM